MREIYKFCVNCGNESIYKDNSVLECKVCGHEYPPQYKYNITNYVSLKPLLERLYKLECLQRNQ